MSGSKFDLRQWRKEMGNLTRYEAAVALGASPHAVKNWEDGTTARGMPAYIEYACRWLKQKKAAGIRD